MYKLINVGLNYLNENIFKNVIDAPARTFMLVLSVLLRGF